MTLEKEHLAANVRVYSKDNCVQCKLTINLLDKLGVPYATEEATTPENVAALKELGYLSAPVVKVGEGDEETWAGFQPDKIKAIAKRIAEGKL